MTTTPPNASSADAVVSASSRQTIGSDEAQGTASSDWAIAGQGTTPTAARPIKIPTAAAGTPRRLTTLHPERPAEPRRVLHDGRPVKAGGRHSQRLPRGISPR